MKKLIASLLCLAAGTAITLAVPAKPGMMRLTQPDGSIVEARIIGDEHFHYYETGAGELLLRDAAGTLRPATVAADGSLRAEGEITGMPTPADSRRSILDAIAAATQKTADNRPARVAPNIIPQKFPTTGTVKGLVLLVEYQDVKLSQKSTVDHYLKICNQAGYSSESTAGSVLDYFSTQSGGKFTPEFDVFGPLTLPRERAYYGATNEGLINQFRDAAIAADAAGLDFSQYDVDKDGFVDFLFVIFAGHGEAQGGPFESVWPAMIDLTDYVFDHFDGLYLGVAAFSCELMWNSGEDLEGVGTICHEFSHILGLADIYDTQSQGAMYGMAHFDLMDVGAYNGDHVYPSGYTAMDKFTLGWLEPIVLEESRKEVTLRPFDTSHDAAFIVNPANPDEYYTLENRQQQGWDTGLPGHGLVASYCHYDKHLWKRNTVNSVAAGYEHVQILAADNHWDSSMISEAGDPFPGTKGVTSISGSSVPAACWKSSGRAVPVEWSVTNIRENADGSVTFDFNATAGVDGIAADMAGVSVEENSIIAPAGSRIFHISGRETGARNLPRGIYIVNTPEGTVKIKL